MSLLEPESSWSCSKAMWGVGSRGVLLALVLFPGNTPPCPPIPWFWAISGLLGRLEEGGCGAGYSSIRAQPRVVPLPL